MRACMAVIAALGTYAAVTLDANAQQVYRWVDKDGRVHYSQEPPSRGAAKSVQQRNLGPASVIESSGPTFALQQAMRNYPVTLYTASNCRQGCPEARELLARRGVPYREISVADEKAMQALKRATGENKVPAITVGTQVQIGYEAQTVHALLDTAGYPRTASFVGKPPALPPAPQTARSSNASPPSVEAPKEGAVSPEPSDSKPPRQGTTD